MMIPGQRRKEIYHFCLLIVAIFVNICLASPRSEQTLDNALLAYWPFDEFEGDMIFDESGHSNDGTIFGNVDWVSGIVGGALRFNNSSAYVEVPHLANFRAMEVTIAVWVYQERTGDTTWSGVVTKGGHNPRKGFSLRFGWYNDMRFGIGGGSDFIGPESCWLDTEQWHFVVGTFDGECVKLYVNGVLAKETGYSGPFEVGTAPIIIGNSQAHNCPFFGKIDEVRIYDRALTAEEIQALYQKALEGD